MQKKVLVTGGAGFIGTNLINQLLKEDAEVFSLDDYSTGNKDNESNCYRSDINDGRNSPKS